MAVTQLTKFIQQVSPSTGSTADTLIGTRGGILLDLSLQWVAYDYWNVGTDQEQPKDCDIHAYITDVATNASILGQANSSEKIVIPSQGSFTWSNPQRDIILDASSVISRLGSAATQSIWIPGMCQGMFRYLFTMDPARTGITHGVNLLARFLAFDSQGI